MEPSKTKMLLHDDVMYQILLRLPVISLYRFKLVCGSWCALIKSSYFIRQHLHLHHYDHCMKDKNRNLIYLLGGKDSSISFPLASIESFEEPKVCLELNCSDLHGCFPVEVLRIVSCNGIICLHLSNRRSEEESICLWNPSTKQSRVLPQSPYVDNNPLSIGFGFDIKNNDFKVVKLIQGSRSAKMRFEVYSLNTGSWKMLTSGISIYRLFGRTRTPFNNGKCYFWGHYNDKSENVGFVCFDFSSEMFRFISSPRANCFKMLRDMGVVNDKIACVLKMNQHQIEMWVFNEYGRANESWTKLYTIDPYSILDWRLYIEGVSMNGNYIFFKTSAEFTKYWLQQQMCRFNVVTKETKYFTLVNRPCSFGKTLVEFKESLVSVEEPNNASICIKDFCSFC